MEFTFTPLRLAVLLALLVGFYFLDGFDPISALGRQVARAWIYSVALFVIGAIMTTIVDHWVGNLDRSNLRWLYVFMGVLAMGGGLMYQYVLRERVKIESGNEVRE